MLRVGLTGDLGSGKSTVARLLAAHGAHLFSSDEIAREMMQPGQPVYAAIIEHFGPEILAADSNIDRRRLARIAFDPTHPRIDELNSLVHPAVICEQLRRVNDLERTDPQAIAVVESALIFSTRYAPGNLTWRERFDVIVLVTAPDAIKVARFIERVAAGRLLTPEERLAIEADARQRLALQRENAEHASECLVLSNDGTLDQLGMRVDALWSTLEKMQRKP